VLDCRGSNGLGTLAGVSECRVEASQPPDFWWSDRYYFREGFEEEDFDDVVFAGGRAADCSGARVDGGV
jgi:hypothetical protein